MIPADGYRIRYTTGTSIAWIANVTSASELRQAEYDAGDQIFPRWRLIFKRERARIHPEVYVEGRWYVLPYDSITRREAEEWHDWLFRLVAATYEAARTPAPWESDDDNGNWWRKS